MTCVNVSIRMSWFESGEFVVFRMRIHDRVASISELSSSTLDYVSKDPFHSNFLVDCFGHYTSIIERWEGQKCFSEGLSCAIERWFGHQTSVCQFV